MDYQTEARLQGLSAGNSKSSKKRRTVNDQFRPPFDLMYKGNFDSALSFGETTNRWLMVNIQNPQDLACQVLNRDVWSNPSVKNLINQHFVFWQVYSTSTDGERYMRYYNPVQFPYISVIDPRTGEKLEEWRDVDATKFFELTNTFLKEYSSPNGTTANSEYSCDAIDEQEVSKNNDKGGSNNKDTWKDYLGSEDDPKIELVLRFPDDTKEQISWPCSTKIKALVLYVEELGYDSEDHELITNYPRRNLCELDICKSLKEVNFCSQVIIVEKKSSF